jgi:hypothetical protein
MVLEGFTYQRLSGRADRNYRQLAAAYRAEGDDRSARKISMERFNAKLRLPGRSVGHLASKGARWVLRLVIGHGYEPWRAIVPLIVLLVVGTVVISAAARDGRVHRHRPA